MSEDRVEYGDWTDPSGQPEQFGLGDTVSKEDLEADAYGGARGTGKTGVMFPITHLFTMKRKHLVKALVLADKRIAELDADHTAIKAAFDNLSDTHLKVCTQRDTAQEYARKLEVELADAKAEAARITEATRTGMAVMGMPFGTITKKTGACPWRHSNSPNSTWYKTIILALQSAGAAIPDIPAVERDRIAELEADNTRLKSELAHARDRCDGFLDRQNDRIAKMCELERKLAAANTFDAETLRLARLGASVEAIPGMHYLRRWEDRENQWECNDGKLKPSAQEALDAANVKPAWQPPAMALPMKLWEVVSSFEDQINAQPDRIGRGYWWDGSYHGKEVDQCNTLEELVEKMHAAVSAEKEAAK